MLKYVRYSLWLLIAVVLVGLVVAKVIVPRPEPGLYPAPQLHLTDQEDQPFSTASLRGHPWVADFMFTTCGNICPVMSQAMEQIQQKTPADVHLVSFSVDPENDSPAVLKKYAQIYHADFSRWHFLTGTLQQMTEAVYAMQNSTARPDKQAVMTHSEKFLLVNASGNVAGIFDGTNPQDVTRLIEMARQLAAKDRR